MASQLDNYGELINLVESMVKEETGFSELHWDEINQSIAPKDKQIAYEQGEDLIKFKNL